MFVIKNNLKQSVPKNLYSVQLINFPGFIHINSLSLSFASLTTHPINSLSVQVWRVPHLLLYSNQIYKDLVIIQIAPNVLTQGLPLLKFYSISPSQAKEKIRLFINFCNNQNSKELLKSKSDLIFNSYSFTEHSLVGQGKVEHKIIGVHGRQQVFQTYSVKQ